MALKKITAIIRTASLETVERRLESLDVPGITVTRVKGFGELVVFAARDWKSAHACVEIFTDEAHEQQIVDSIIDSAGSGLPGDGIVAVAAVERLIRIRNRCELREVFGTAESHSKDAA